MDSSFLKAHAARCRSLAEIADEFTKKRLLDLATRYDGESVRLSRASRAILPSVPLMKAGGLSPE
jgi:hypothetical protein